MYNKIAFSILYGNRIEKAIFIHFLHLYKILIVSSCKLTY